MNKKLIIRVLGLILLSEAIALVPCLYISLFYKEDTWIGFVFSIIITAFVGGLMIIRGVWGGNVGHREGFAIATFGWLLLVVFGSLPYILTGALPNLVDAFFETMSGFTTTGASVVTNVEGLPRGILFWRSLTQWLGGMGVLVLTVALIPSLRVAGLEMFKAEMPGPTKIKVLPRVADTSRQLYKIYLIFTVSQIILLKIAGMNWFDSFIHSFSSVAIGGFSSRNTIAAYDSVLIEAIIVFFIVISGISFALHFHTLRGNFRPLFKDYETRVYLAILLLSISLVTYDLVSSANYNHAQAFRDSVFQVSSIGTTTGFVTADYNLWPPLSQAVLLTLMFVGGCVGSTAGSIKISRYIILYKVVLRQIMSLLHPQAVIPVRIGKNVISEEVVDNVQTFFFLYFFTFAISIVLLTFLGVDLVTAIAAVAANISNVGPGFAAVGPMSNYALLPAAAKVILSLDMLLGRLEIYTVIVVFTSSFWKR